MWIQLDEKKGESFLLCKQFPQPKDLTHCIFLHRLLVHPTTKHEKKRVTRSLRKQKLLGPIAFELIKDAGANTASAKYCGISFEPRPLLPTAAW
jgi:hypothetical protein